jgi:arsenate reductase
VVEAMREVDIDLVGKTPTRLDPDQAREADVVVTMGCGDACPVYPGTRYEDWQVEDPSDKSIEEVRLIRDDIERRVRSLIAELS